jgi:hypothetical protein
MERADENPTRCKGPWSGLALAGAVAGATAMIWAAFQFGTDGGKADAAAAGAQMFALTLGPIWACSGARRCRMFSRKAKASPDTDQRPWHER